MSRRGKFCFGLGMVIIALGALAGYAQRAEAKLTAAEVRRAAIADTGALAAASPESKFEGQSIGCRKLRYRPATRCWVSIWGSGYNPLVAFVDETTGEGLETGEAWTAEFQIVVRGRSCRRAVVEDAEPFEPQPRSYNVCASPVPSPNGVR